MHDQFPGPLACVVQDPGGAVHLLTTARIQLQRTD